MLTYIKKELKENDQEEFQNDQIKIQKIIKGKNIEDKEDNYGYYITYGCISTRANRTSRQ